jgi:hypothetical protein
VKADFRQLLSESDDEINALSAQHDRLVAERTKLQERIDALGARLQLARDHKAEVKLLADSYEAANPDE